MNIYLTPSPKFGRGIQRVAQALAESLPAGHQIVPEATRADLWIHHVIGVRNFHETTDLPQVIAQAPQMQHAVIQYCLRSTEQPDPTWWQANVWRHCKLVWSYYDLNAAFGYDQVNATLGWFYEAPLGVDPVFHARAADRPQSPIFLVCTSGYVPETEGVLECVEAARRVGGKVLHLGPSSLNLGPHVSYVEGIPDVQLAALYRNCRFVAGLRRVEGFELPAAEGLCAGATPILFDQPHYTRWFGEAGIYVLEESPESVTNQLTAFFELEVKESRRGPAFQVDAVDIALAQRTFSWPRVCKGFWDRVLAEPARPVAVPRVETTTPPFVPNYDIDDSF